MKANIVFTIMSLLIAVNGYSQEQILGNWFAKDLDNSTIQIYESEQSYFGKIIKSDIDAYIGKIVLKDLKYDKDSDTWTGTIYSIKRDMNINGILSLETDGKLKVIGKKFFMTKTFYWVRR